MKTLIILAVVVVAALGRPQGYEPDSEEHVPSGVGVGDDDGRQGRTFGLVSKGFHSLRNRIFGAPAPYFGGGGGYAPCGASGYNQQLSSNLPLTPYAL